MSFGLVERDAAYTSASTQSAESTTLAKQFSVNFSPLSSYDLITLAPMDFVSYSRGKPLKTLFCANNKRYYLPPINISTDYSWELYLPASSANGNWVEFVFLCAARSVVDSVTILGPSTYDDRYYNSPFTSVITGMVIQNDVPTYYENAAEVHVKYGPDTGSNTPTDVACNLKCVYADRKWIVSGLMHWAEV